MALLSKYASVDTCILVRLMIHDIPSQYDLALDLILNGQSFYVDPAVISESVYVLTKLGKARKDIAGGIQTLLSNEVFIYDRELYGHIFERYLTHPSLSFDDCVLEARAEAKGYTPLWTFDQKFAHQSETARLLTY